MTAIKSLSVLGFPSVLRVTKTLKNSGFVYFYKGEFELSKQYFNHAIDLT